MRLKKFGILALTKYQIILCKDLHFGLKIFVFVEGWITVALFMKGESELTPYLKSTFCLFAARFDSFAFNLEPG